jgi:amidohydrolase
MAQSLDIPGNAKLSEPVTQILPDTIAARRHLHAHPELGFEEHETAAYITQSLETAGLTPNRVLDTGVTTLLDTGRPGKTLMVRADIDALPIIEAGDVEYISKNEGVMHACGHDGHAAIGLSAVRITQQQLDQLNGRAFFVFQPAEETIGAKTMIDTGFLDAVNPDNAVGLHIWNQTPIGKVGVTTGPCMAAVDKLHITIKGVGGHAAIPDETSDAIVIASQVISALQQVVSRNVSPLDAAVVTIGSINGGRGFNIIADEVRLEGTIRTYKPEVQDRVHARVHQLVESIAKGLEGEGIVSIEKTCPPLVNDADMAEMVREVAAEIVGADNLIHDEQTMGGEDMAFFMNRIPGCYFFVGAGNEAKGLSYPHHHPKFDFDEAALGIGLEIMTGVIRKYLG